MTIPIIRRLIRLCLIATLIAPSAIRVDAARPEVAVVSPMFRMTVDALPAAPVSVTISRIIFTPGSDDSSVVLPGPRLILVESGSLAFRASGDVPIIRTKTSRGPGPTATPTLVPTPTPPQSPTTDTLLETGDAAPVPIWTMHSLRNTGGTPAVILDVRIMDAQAAAPPANLDGETLAAEEGVTTLTTGRASIVLGFGTTAPGGMVLAPPAAAYQLVAPAGGAGQLERADDGSVHNVGTDAQDVYVLLIAEAGVASVRQPTQPATGPGGSDYAFDRVVATHYGPDDRSGFWLYEPADPRPGSGLSATDPLPVVLFLGGCCDIHIEPFYGNPPYDVMDWIEHLTKRGAVVIYPLFRAERLDDFTGGLQGAISELESGSHPPVDWSRFAAIGYSYGGWYAPLVAAAAADQGLPVPHAIFSTVAYDPGTTPDLSAIPASTRVVVLVAEADFEWKDRGARRIWAALTGVPSDHRAFVRLMDDRHGAPSLQALHQAPGTAVYASLNAHDWYGTWRLGDALLSCAFAEQDCAYAFGNTPEQRFMGYWSDGVPVVEMEVIADPGPPDPATPTA